ncbi:uncharacterized protein LOC132205073 [Neocloeon triangulifer]|uniref:uncharacterized protein LOC132205073 n=1 Tax=Neocloeon triangulifer TaxID=2078957 RepID=UPI00286EBB2D|nr:uncharacterized protein LOC132205073 [Neocloeon triangulifer]
MNRRSLAPITKSLASKSKLIQKGDEANCEFLVGPDGRTKVKIFALKLDLCAASEIFRNMLKSPLTPPSGPIEIKTEPKIFTCLMQFIHTGAILENLDGKLDDIIELGQTSDMYMSWYMVDPLTKLMAEMLQSHVNTNNVVKVLNQVCRIKALASACDKTIRVACVNSKLISAMSLGSLEYFVKVDEINVSDEFELVDAFNKLERTIRKKVFTTVLPHIQVLLLNAEQLRQLSAHLTEEEMNVLAKRLVFNVEPKELPRRICPIKIPRRSTQSPLTGYTLDLNGEKNFHL